MAEKQLPRSSIEDTNPQQLAEYILGETEQQNSIDRIQIDQTSSILHIEDVTVKANTGKNLLDGIDLEICSGEIIGIAGVEGNGQTELVEVLTGLRKIQSGTITLNGESVINASPAELREKHIVHLPADRHRTRS